MAVKSKSSEAAPNEIVTLTIRGKDYRFGYNPAWEPPIGEKCGTDLGPFGKCRYRYQPSDRDDLTGQALLNSKPLHFCPPPVVRMEKFAEGLALVDGEFDGEPFVLLDWVAEVIQILFGVMAWSPTGRQAGFARLIQEVVISMPRGQMKSTFIQLLIAAFLTFWPDGSEGCFAQQSIEETMKKLVPKTERMLRKSPVCDRLDWRWRGTTRTIGGSHRFSRGDGDVSTRPKHTQHLSLIHI